MTPDEKIKQFHWCCQEIIKAGNNSKDVKMVNYAYNYAQCGSIMTDVIAIRHQIPYLLSNITRWRGEVAKEVRAALKSLKTF